MAVSREFQTYVEDCFSIVPAVTVRRMFGGLGIFRNGLMFAIATSEGKLAFKADEQTFDDFIAEGAGEWIYNDQTGRAKRMGYWYAPEWLVDEPEEFREWALKAFAAARRADMRKPAAQRKLHP
jgi:DNA transformation protein and related proteins